MVGEFEGSCHCGAIRWKFRTHVEPREWPVRACQCSFCRTHAARCTSDPEGSVEFSTIAPGEVQHLRFGMSTADFLVCRNCGVYVGAVVEDSTGCFSTLNLNSMETVVHDLQDPAPVFYDSENREERIKRRKLKWTPVTTRI